VDEDEDEMLSDGLNAGARVASPMATSKSPITPKTPVVDNLRNSTA